MKGFDLKHFIDTFDFDQLIAFFTTDAWKVLLDNKVIWAVCAIFLGLIAYPKTRGLGTSLLTWTLVVIIYGVGGVVLRNSVISQIGPFLLGMGLALAAVGYFVWLKLLKH